MSSGRHTGDSQQGGYGSGKGHGNADEDKDDDDDYGNDQHDDSE